MFSLVSPSGSQIAAWHSRLWEAVKMVSGQIRRQLCASKLDQIIEYLFVYVYMYICMYFHVYVFIYTLYHIPSKVGRLLRRLMLNSAL